MVSTKVKSERIGAPSCLTLPYTIYGDVVERDDGRRGGENDGLACHDGRGHVGRRIDLETVHVCVNLMTVYSLAVAGVELDHPSRLGYLDHGGVQALHFRVEFFLTDNQDDIDCERE